MDYYEKFFSNYNILANCLDFGGIDIINCNNSTFFKEVDVVLLICDLFNDNISINFSKLSNLIKNQSSRQVHFIFVRNKCDFNPISNEESQNIRIFCKINHFKSVLVSAKTLQNFNQLQDSIFSSIEHPKEQDAQLGYSEIENFSH